MIRGVGVDEYGRCVHWHGPHDVVANKCATCEKWWACYRCHAALADHDFGRMPADNTPAVRCGVCGYRTGFREYNRVTRCPGCTHEFNPGCAGHRHLYFDVS